MRDEAVRVFVIEFNLYCSCQVAIENQIEPAGTKTAIRVSQLASRE